MRLCVVALLLRVAFVVVVCIRGITFTTCSLSIAPQQLQHRHLQQQRRQNEQKILLLTRRFQSNQAKSKNSSSNYYETPEQAYQELLQCKQQLEEESSTVCWESPTLAVLKLCYRHVCFLSNNNNSTNTTIDADWARAVWQTMCPESLAARQAVIQMYSQQLHQHLKKNDSQAIHRAWNQIRKLVYLTSHTPPSTTIALLNSALAAAPTGADALLLYQETHTMLPWTTLSYNLVLSKLTPDNSTASVEFLEDTMIPAQCYNRQSFQILLSRKENDPVLVQRLQQLCMASSTSLEYQDLFPPTNASKRPKWPEHIMQRLNENSATNKQNATAGTMTSKHFVVATMGPFTVTAQPNRQSNTDLRLILWDTQECQPQRVGYMLLTTAETGDSSNHSISTTTSSLMGVYLDPGHRQKGLSKQFMTCWLQLCERAHLIPQTEIIRKPLLCLVLQHSLGFVPITNGEGVDIEVYPPSEHDNKIRVYASTRCLEGIFSPWDVQREQLDLCAQRPSAFGRTIRIHGRFVRSMPNDADGEEWNCSLTGAELRTILIGEPAKS